MRSEACMHRAAQHDHCQVPERLWDQKDMQSSICSYRFLVLLATTSEQMAGRDDMEPWYWQDESFKLDSEFPLAISTSFWEELTHSGGGSPNLFGTAPPLVDTKIHLSKPLHHAITLDHQGSDSNGSSSSEYIKQHGERYKRRRMLHFAGSRTEGIVPGSPTCVNILGSPTVLQSSLRSCIPALVSNKEEFIVPVPCGPPGSPTSLWFSRVDNVSDSVPAHLQQPADKWMCRSFEDKAYSVYEQMKAPILPFSDHDMTLVGGNHVQQTWQQQSLSFQLSRTPEEKLQVLQSQHRLQKQQLQEAEVLQGPQTPFSRPPIPGRKQSTGPSRFKGKSSNCVAFPFALVKPSAAQGDVTLNDINKHLLTPPPMPEQKPFPINIEKPPAQSGAGLSGKSVVACTKIHTEGHGTITIMRTRG